MIRKPQNRRHRKLTWIWFPVVVLVMFFLNDPSLSAGAKLTPEVLVARHLESIGTAQALAAVKTRIITGNCLVIFRTPPPGQAGGRVVIASEGAKSLIGMIFPSPVYPREQLGFNGSSFTAAFVTPGVRSVLGNFLMTHSIVFKQGLMGGTLSSAWPLLDLIAKNPHLEYAGIRKIDNRLLHELKFLPRGGSELQVRLFFDQKSFQHVRTEYERVIAAAIGTRSSIDPKETETHYKMSEEFSDFKNEDGLTLPHSYKISLTVDSQGGTFLAEWAINLAKFTFNEPIDPNSFRISPN